jgi:hypothetical protein
VLARIDPRDFDIRLHGQGQLEEMRASLLRAEND